MSRKIKPQLTCIRKAALEYELRRYGEFLNSIPVDELEIVLKVCKAIQAGDAGGILPNEQQVYQRHILASQDFSMAVIVEHNRRKAEGHERIK